MWMYLYICHIINDKYLDLVSERIWTRVLCINFATYSISKILWYMFGYYLKFNPRSFSLVIREYFHFGSRSYFQHYTKNWGINSMEIIKGKGFPLWTCYTILKYNVFRRFIPRKCYSSTIPPIRIKFGQLYH